MKKIFDAMGWQLLISLLISANCFGQTTAEKIALLSKKIDTINMQIKILNAANSKLLGISSEQDIKITKQQADIIQFGVSIDSIKNITTTLLYRFINTDSIIKEFSNRWDSAYKNYDLRGFHGKDFYIDSNKLMRIIK